MNRNITLIAMLAIALLNFPGCKSLSEVMTDIRAFNEANKTVYGKNTIPYKGIATLKCRTGEKKYTLSLQPRDEKKMLFKVYQGEGWDGPVIGEREIYYNPKEGLPNRSVPYGTRGGIKAKFVKLPDGTKALGGEFTDNTKCAGVKGTVLLVPYKDTQYTTLGQ